MLRIRLLIIIQETTTPAADAAETPVKEKKSKKDKKKAKSKEKKKAKAKENKKDKSQPFVLYHCRIRILCLRR